MRGQLRLDAQRGQLSLPLDSDFLGVGEWSPTDPNVASLGGPDYGSVAAVCGYGSDQYQTPVVLFHDRRRWDVVDSYPSSPLCRDKVFLPPWEEEGIANGTCSDKTGPNEDDCCSCTYSATEYATGDGWGQNLGQRPWVAGIYRRKTDGREVCVVAGEFPHPLANVTLWDLDGRPTWSWNEDTPEQPFTIMPYVCTTQYSPSICVNNLDGTAVVFGTDVFVRSVAEFCGPSRDVIIMADTNIGMGDFPSSKLMTDPYYSALTGGTGTTDLEPYTCCNDTSYDGGMNRYASDRIMVLGRNGDADAVQVNDLQGGSVAPGGPLPEDLAYKCHANQEHAPLRAFISLPVLEG